jgi:hypothetical protein
LDVSGARDEVVAEVGVVDDKANGAAAGNGAAEDETELAKSEMVGLEVDDRKAFEEGVLQKGD